MIIETPLEQEIQGYDRMEISPTELLRPFEDKYNKIFIYTKQERSEEEKQKIRAAKLAELQRISDFKYTESIAQNKDIGMEKAINIWIEKKRINR